MPSRSPPPGPPHIDRLDYHSPDSSNTSRTASSTPLLNALATRMVASDSRRLAMAITRVCALMWSLFSALCAGGIATFSLYAPFFLRDLHYSQYRVNAVAIVAEVAMYLPVSVFGYLCDRYTPRPISLVSAVLFATGYGGAATVYWQGASAAGDGKASKDGDGFAWMLLSFVCIGMGTCCMYLSAVTTCAKNFGRGRHKGLMLALPIAAFGVSGMWQAQVGSFFLTRPASSKDYGSVELDPGKYFVFLAILLGAVGIGGTFALRVVDEEELLSEAVDDLERSGLLDGSHVEDRQEDGEVQGNGVSSTADAYDTSGLRDSEDDGDTSETALLTTSSSHPHPHPEIDDKTKAWLLNYETRLFLRDKTMWLLAIGFLLVTGPSEAYINNLGSMIDSLTPRQAGPNQNNIASPGSPSTHISTIALTSTIARLLAGSLSDLFSPSPNDPSKPPSRRFSHPTPVVSANSPTLSRMLILLPTLLVLFLGFLLLSTPFPVTIPSLLHLTTGSVGTGYGAAFALVPIVIACVWGLENFGTNWGIVAMFPAAGAAVWGVVYSAVYEGALKRGRGEDDGHGVQKCVGWECYGWWAVGCAASVGLAMCLLGGAWWRWRRKGVVV
ncbi:putative monocarboxylate transporter mch1 [Ascosphaera atra]|nr:putative monocarboxylate transporter mch1 [Ascosphaera atra]